MLIMHFNISVRSIHEEDQSAVDSFYRDWHITLGFLKVSEDINKFINCF